MRNISFILCFILIASLRCIGQDDWESLLPFLKGEKYGVVNGKGKTVLPYEFNNIIIHNDLKMIAAMRGDLWGLYTLGGDILLDHVIKDKSQYGFTGPALQPMVNVTLSDKWDGIPIPSLYKVNDDFANVCYIINPEYPQISYKAFAGRFRKNKDTHSTSSFPITKLFRVVQRDGKINFVNDQGVLLFDSGVVDGFVISDRFYAISNGEKYALYIKGKALTDPIYKSFYQTSTKGLFKGIVEKTSDKGNKIKEYHLFNSEGEILDKSENNISSNKYFSIVNKDEGSFIYGEYGKLIRTFFNQRVKYKYFGWNHYLLSENKHKYGLYDREGQAVLDTIYSSISFQFPYVFCGIKDRYTVLDSNFTQILEVDSINSLQLSKSDQYFKFSVKDGWRQKYGLMDLNGKYLIPPIWNKINVSNCKDFAELGTDTSSFIYKFGTGKIVYPTENITAKFNVQFNCDKDFVGIVENELYIRLDSEGNVIDTSELVNNQMTRSLTHAYTSKKVGGKYELQDANGNNVLATSFEDIDIIYDKKYDKSTYICQFAKNKHPSTLVYNDDLKSITPQGYSLPEGWTRWMDENPGTILVANDADVLKDKYNFRVGMIDYDGNWLVRPFYGLFKHILPNLIIVQDYDKKEYVFYNQKGQKATDKNYDIIVNSNGSDFFQNRIMVGVLQDKSYIDKVNSIKESTSDYFVVLEKLKKLEEPLIHYGYIDKLANEIIEPQFTNAKNFGLSEETTFVSKMDNKGNPVSYLIDTLGNVLFSAPFEEMDFLGKTHYKVKKDDYWAITDTFGTVQTPFIFKYLYKDNFAGGIFEGSDSTKYYMVSSEYKIREIEKNGRIDLKKINSDFFYLKIANRVENKFNMIFHLFSKELELIQTFENIVGFSDQFNWEYLPKDYISVIPQKPAKPYVINTVTKIILKE